MKKQLPALLICAAVSYWAGCALLVSAASVGADDGGKATVYIYRYKQYVGAALRPSVYCDENEIGRARNGRYFTVKLPPGLHTFHSNDKQSGVRLDLQAAHNYYIRVDLAPGLLKGHGRLVLATDEQGAFEVKQLQPYGVAEEAERDANR